MNIHNLVKGVFYVSILSSTVAAGLIFPRTATSQTTKSQTTEASPEKISIQSFSAPWTGVQVTKNLPIYKIQVKGGILVDDSGKPFSSYRPQSTKPTDESICKIENIGWRAYYTTFYVVLANDQNNLYLVKSCGKSPLKLNSTEQYSNINKGNFIDHAQIAGRTKNGDVNKVIAAGEIDVIDGEIVYMDNCSGHFKPNVGSLLAYMSQWDNPKPIALTSNLKTIISTGSITGQQISRNLIYMTSVNNDIPKRDVRAGTGHCYSYTTVFNYKKIQGMTYLSGGLLAYQKGNINIFQSDINTITNKNIKRIELTSNFGIYSYAAYVTTDLHFHNNTLNFEFTDETDDTYSLYIFNYSYNHAVDYNSAMPNIKTITFH